VLQFYGTCWSTSTYESEFQHLIRFIRQVETDSHPTALPLISQRAFIIQHKPPSPAISALHQKLHFKETAFITSATW
jgi:hypothetical protein